MKKSVLFYKTSKTFSRFIKNSYLENCQTYSYNRYDVDDIGTDDYAIAFVLIENMEDLAIFTSIYANSEKVFAISTLNEINHILSKLDNITLLDNNMLRKDIIKLIEGSFKTPSSGF